MTCVDGEHSTDNTPVAATRAGPFIVAVAIAAGLLFGTGIPMAAAAAASSVEYSRDGGSTWSALPPSFLFSSSMRFVPGDVAIETVVIRSLRPDPTLVQISLANATTDDSLLESALTVEGSDANGAGLPPTRFDDLTVCQPVVPDRVLAEGETVSVSLTLRVSETVTGRQAQDSIGYFDLALALSDSGPAVAQNGCAVNAVLIPGAGTPSESGTAAGDQRAGGAGLAYTGLAVAYPALITAVIALGAGAVFVLWGRRRRRGSE